MQREKESERERRTPPINYIQAAPVKESRIDKAYITSIRGILKLACLVNFPDMDRFDVTFRHESL
jgi:hypothetical protein